jgi:hypothetical protein
MHGIFGVFIVGSHFCSLRVGAGGASAATFADL